MIDKRQEDAIAVLCGELYYQDSRQHIAGYLNQIQRKSMTVKIPGHEMHVYQVQGCTHIDEATETKLNNGSFSPDQIWQLINTLRGTLGLKPLDPKGKGWNPNR